MIKPSTYHGRVAYRERCVLSITVVDVAMHWLGGGGLLPSRTQCYPPPPKQSLPILIFLYESAQNALFHTKYLRPTPAGEKYTRSPDRTPYAPTAPTPAPSVRPWHLRLLFSTPQWLKPPHSKNPGYVPETSRLIIKETFLNHDHGPNYYRMQMH